MTTTPVAPERAAGLAARVQRVAAGRSAVAGGYQQQCPVTEKGRCAGLPAGQCLGQGQDRQHQRPVLDAVAGFPEVAVVQGEGQGDGPQEHGRQQDQLQPAAPAAFQAFAVVDGSGPHVACLFRFSAR